jgi:PRTRC genetic system protein A
VPIPLYLKTDPDMPRPADPEFYWLTQNGTFLCRNHPFFTSDVLTRRPIRALAAHEPRCEIRYPKVKQSTLEFIVGFFDRVYEMHRSEAVVLLLWDLAEQRYRIWVPQQEATVWRGWTGSRSPVDVRYHVPASLPPRCLLMGDIHSHGNMAAFASATDEADEVHRDGVHGVVGRINNEPPDFHLELAIDGQRFELEFEQLFEGYAHRRRFVPRKWLEQVKIVSDGPTSYYSKRSRDDSWSGWQA